jgi:hypothetical protein
VRGRARQAVVGSPGKRPGWRHLPAGSSTVLRAFPPAEISTPGCADHEQRDGFRPRHARAPDTRKRHRHGGSEARRDSSHRGECQGEAGAASRGSCERRWQVPGRDAAGIVAAFLPKGLDPGRALVARDLSAQDPLVAACLDARPFRNEPGGPVCHRRRSGGARLTALAAVSTSPVSIGGCRLRLAGARTTRFHPSADPLARDGVCSASGGKGEDRHRQETCLLPPVRVLTVPPARASRRAPCWCFGVDRPGSGIIAGSRLAHEAMTAARVDDEPSMAAVIALMSTY